MNYIFESIFVGFYSIIIYFIINSILLYKNISINISLILFNVGFFKHFISYFIGLYTYYCNNGSSCKNKNDVPKKALFPGYINLIKESFIEGILFLLLGGFILFFIKKKEYAIFLIGFLLHIFAEHVGIHKDFCKTQCKVIIKKDI
jgi:hypothetical protein